MRRFPWGIQLLVSTHQFPHNPKVPRSVQTAFSGEGGRGQGCGPHQLKLKVLRSIQINTFFVGGGRGCGPDQLKSKVPRSIQINMGGGLVVVQTNSNPNCQNVSKSAFGGWGSWSRSTQTQSAKIYPNQHGGGGVACGPDQLKPKVSRSVQICIWGGEGLWSRPTQTQSAKMCPNLHLGRGGVWSRPTQTQSAKIYPDLHGGRGLWSRPTQTQSAKMCPNLHGGDCGPDQLKSKVPRSVQITWGGVVQTNPNPKCQHLSKSAFSEGGGEGVVVQTNILEILEGGGVHTKSNLKCQDKSSCEISEAHCWPKGKFRSSFVFFDDIRFF